MFNAVVLPPLRLSAQPPEADGAELPTADGGSYSANGCCRTEETFVARSDSQGCAAARAATTPAATRNGAATNCAKGDDGVMADHCSSEHGWNWTLCETIPSEADAGKPVLDRVMQRLEADSWVPHDLFGVRLALEEAIVNAIKHGNGFDPAKSVTIDCKLSHCLLRVEIEDDGEGFDPADVPDPTDPENLENPSGRGLMLMRYYMSVVDFNERGNRVILEKERASESAA
jgi:serine/threonine-protein kinase RsbW